MKKLLAIFLAVSVSGCSLTDRHSALKPDLPVVSAKDKKKCARLITLPDHDLSQEETSAIIAQLRHDYGACIRMDDKRIAIITVLESLGGKR